MPPEPRLEGESDQAYQARVDTLRREQAERWLKERQAVALRRAEVIFIARDTAWYPDARPRVRNGRLLPLRPLSYPAPSYFKPLAWFRGRRTTDLFQLRAGYSSCGPMGFGDTTSSRHGDRFVFFARKGRVTQDSLIDAIAIDKIDDPALLAFVMKHRGPARR